MKPPREIIRTLWCRQISGEQLDDQEQQRLRDALRDEPELLSELSDDATSHALLRSLEEVVQTEDDFLQTVIQKVRAIEDVEAAPAESTPLGATVQTNSAQTSQRELSGLPVLEGGRFSNGQRKNSLRRSQKWMPFLLTLTLFLAVGLNFWFLNRDQPGIANNGSPATESGVDPTTEIATQQNNSDPVLDEKFAATDEVDSGDVETSEDLKDSAPQLATNDHRLTPATTEEAPVNGELPNMVEETVPAVVSQTFATLTKLENPIWERDDNVGSRVGDDVVRLFGGTIELTFDDGAVVTLQGPVEFQARATDQLHLRRGQVSATIPRPAIGFTVLTPTSEVVDLGTEFDVSVKDSGASDIVVRKGEVEVAPGGRNGKNIQTWKLTPRGLNQASFYARPEDGQPGPIAAKAQGANGQFQGIISLDGKKAEFRSAETFNNVHERVMAQFETSQENTQLQWKEFVDSLQRKIRGTMNFNGREMQFGNFDDVMRLHNQLQNQLKANQAASFTGSININGKVIQFKTREEFEVARRAAFGPAANFGAGDILDTQRGPR